MSEKNLEGRCITIARVRAGLTTKELADRLFYTVALVSNWERGVRSAHWDELYATLPELPEIRKKGCAAYCPKSEWCKQDGHCLIARAGKFKGYLNPEYVRVVRCKNCRRGAVAIVHEKEVVRCPYLERCMDLNGFCSFGERRATNEAD